MKQTFLRMLLWATIFLSSCQQQQVPINTLSMLEQGKTFAVPTGTVADQFVIKRFPDAKVVYFNTVLDCALAVKDGKADAAVYDLPILKNIASKYDELTVLSEMLVDDSYGFAVQPDNHELKTAMDQTLATIKSDGRYEAMMKRWFPENGPLGEMPEMHSQGENGILRFGTSAVTEPMSFYDKNHQIVGFDIEYAACIAETLGKKLEIVDMEFGALLPALLSGKVDMVGAGMSITEERAKKVLFSDCYYPSGIAALVKKTGTEQPAGQPEAESKEEDLSNKKIGVLLGSVYDRYATKKYPSAEIFQYQNVPDMLTALMTEKTDVAFFEDACLQELLQNNNRIRVLKRNIFTIPIGAGFNKESDQLRQQYNSFIQEIKSNGVYDDMYQRWIEQGRKDLPEIMNTRQSGSLKVGLSADLGFPYVGIYQGKLTGIEIETALRFAAYLNKELIISDMPFGSLIAAISTGKIDFIQSSMMITEERQKQIDFSDPYFETGGSLIALKKDLSPTPTARFASLDDVADKRIGLLTGTVFDAYTRENFPKARIHHYDVTSDMILALQTEKVDAVMLDVISTRVIMNKNPEIAILSDDLLTMPLGVGFSKNNPELRREFNQFLEEIKNNGAYDEMHTRWFTGDAEKVVMPEFNIPENGKKLTVAVSVGDLPYVAYVEGRYVGFDIEMLMRFAQNRNYNLEMISMEFSSLIAALHSGKVDMISDAIAISEERSKMVDFSDPYADFSTAMVVLKKNMTPGSEGQKDIRKTSFFKSVSNSFYSNIILENRYLLILNGLKVTILISILSALLGTILGALICFFRMSKNKTATITAGLFIDLVRGTPVLVLLMIIFYVVFASVNIDPVIVAIIAFGINFGAYVSEMFRSAIESIDRGQREAGIAAGFTRAQTFIHIIMPQALQRVLPVYKGEFISLVKMTSIVGYIAVQDLTKASDIIRSRTFDAFFPLIMAAVLYIAIAGLLTWALSFIEISVDPKKRKLKKIEEIGL